MVIPAEIILFPSASPSFEFLTKKKIGFCWRNLRLFQMQIPPAYRASYFVPLHAIPLLFSDASTLWLAQQNFVSSFDLKTFSQYGTLDGGRLESLSGALGMVRRTCEVDENGVLSCFLVGCQFLLVQFSDFGFEEFRDFGFAVVVVFSLFA